MKGSNGLNLAMSCLRSNFPLLWDTGHDDLGLHLRLCVPFIVFCVASGVTAPPLSTMRLSRIHDWLIVTWDLDSDAAQSDDADRLPVLQVHPADHQGLRASCLGALSIVVESGVLYSVTRSFLLKFSSVNSGAIFAAGPGPISMHILLPSHNNMIRKITRRRNRTKMALFERNLE
ncbi:hypothetical protein EDB83DRAFT_387187 [Lactarius deliciosus]|nr:hypothetical protein EDB83DRAFT_387187 [Lactarius deliciosus]